MSTQLAVWDSGGILLTYWCNAACAHCYENSGPVCRGTVPPDDVRGYLRELRRLGWSGPALHFAGGEPFYDYEHLIDCFEAAAREDMLPLGKLETNAFWCSDDELVRERLTEIGGFGIVELLISSDAFHQEFVPIEKVERAVRIGREVLGESRVRVRFWEFLENPVDVTRLTEDEKDEVFRQVLKACPERMVGRAARALSHLVEKHPKEKFAATDCEESILLGRHIHIDPYGNIFPAACAGLILGNANREQISAIHDTFEYDSRPVLKTLVERGPVPLLEEAIQCGFEEDGEGYATKCHLCFEARAFFWERGLHQDEIGPGEVYAAQ